MNAYVPRRQNKRWLDGDCPREILAIYYDKREPCDPYTIFYAQADFDGSDYWFTYIGGSEDGLTYHGSLRRYQVENFRHRNAHRARKWSEVHAGMKRSVMRDIAWMKANANG